MTHAHETFVYTSCSHVQYKLAAGCLESYPSLEVTSSGGGCLLFYDKSTMEEEALVLTLFSSFSAVFREAGTPVDVNYVVEMMRNAVVSRGLTRKTCIRLVDAIQILSKFGVGFLTVEELKNQLRVGGEAQDAAAKVRVICSCFYCLFLYVALTAVFFALHLARAALYSVYKQQTKKGMKTYKTIPLIVKLFSEKTGEKRHCLEGESCEVGLACKTGRGHSAALKEKPC